MCEQRRKASHFQPRGRKTEDETQSSRGDRARMGTYHLEDRDNANCRFSLGSRAQHMDVGGRTQRQEPSERAAEPLDGKGGGGIDAGSAARDRAQTLSRGGGELHSDDVDMQ